MGIITIKIDDETESTLRKVAKEKYKGKKGYLGKGVTEAVNQWTRDKKLEEIRKRALARVEKGWNMGKIEFDREKLHERHYNG